MNTDAPTPPLPAADLKRVLQATVNLWPLLRGRAVVLTGGTGVAGRWLLETFVHANQSLRLHARAVVLTRSPEWFAARAPHLAGDEAVQLVRGDVRDFDPARLAECAGPAGSIPLVIHGATAGPTRYSLRTPLRVFETLYLGTRRVLEWAAAEAVDRVLLLSSSAVYEPPTGPALPLAEEFAGAPACDEPVNALAEGQRAMELLGAIFRAEHGLDCKVARCFPAVGPGMSLGRPWLVGTWIQDALTAPAVRVPEMEERLVSCLYWSDAVAWLWALSLGESVSNVFNIGSDEAITLGAMAERVGELGPRRLPVVRSASASLAALPVAPIPNIARARQELGVRIEVPLEAAMRKTLKHCGAESEQAPPLAVAV